MFLNISVIEWIGYIASVVVAVSLTMSSIIKLRWYNLAGSVVFSFYGFAIGSLPVGLLNLFIAIANIYYLISIYSRKEAFKILSIQHDNAYFKYFLDYYHHEIERFFPDFKKFKNSILEENKNPLTLLILRNAAVAGIFIGQKNGDEVLVDLDFVIPEYRDLKPGNYLFSKNAGYFTNQGIFRIRSLAKNKKHFYYLKQMGFMEQKSDSNEQYLVKTLRKN